MYGIRSGSTNTPWLIDSIWDANMSIKRGIKSCEFDFLLKHCFKTELSWL